MLEYQHGIVRMKNIYLSSEKLLLVSREQVNSGANDSWPRYSFQQPPNATLAHLSVFNFKGIAFDIMAVKSIVIENYPSTTESKKSFQSIPIVQFSFTKTTNLQSTMVSVPLTHQKNLQPELPKNQLE